MNILDRDHLVVLAVGQFDQLTSSQVRSLLVEHFASATSFYRSINRLTERKFLHRIERRLRGGTGAGSTQYVYQLGSEGWKLLQRESKWRPALAAKDHTLAIADAAIELKNLERSGAIRIDQLMTEPETWQEIAGAKLLPDMFVDIAVLEARHNVVAYLEIDLGTERHKQIADKLARYWHAAQHSEFFPRIYFIVPNEVRAREIRWSINQGDPEARELFRVGLAEDFPTFLFG